MIIHQHSRASLRLQHCCLLLASLLTTAKVHAQEPVIDPTTPDSVSEPAINMHFYADLDNLKNLNSADDQLLVPIKDEKILILKHWARGKIFKGNIILLHAQGEHADHPRISRNLAKQFSTLGWQVYLPNLPHADFQVKIVANKNIITPDNITQPENNTASADATNNQVTNINAKITSDITPTDSTPSNSTATLEETKVRATNYFADEQSYQQLFNQLFAQVIQTIEVTNEPLVVIALQTSAYWILDPVKESDRVSHIVLFHPQLPKGSVVDLETKFSGQTLPVFTFTESQNHSNAFIRSFDQQFWRSPIQRFHQGHFSRNGIQAEDSQYSRLISGWIQSQLNAKK